MPAYYPTFERGDGVCIREPDALESFRREWTEHHPLTDDQMGYAGRECVVADVAFYHGGDVLYTLNDKSAGANLAKLPGLWHEGVLIEAPPSWRFCRASEVFDAVADVRGEQPVVVVRNKKSGVEYLVLRHGQANLVAQQMSEVFSARDAHSIALRYGFELDVPWE